MISWVPPGSRVKVWGSAVSISVSEAETVQFTGISDVLLNTRVQLHLPRHPAFVRPGRFNVEGSPFSDGSAALKFSAFSSRTKPARVALLTSTRPPPRSKGVAG